MTPLEDKVRKALIDSPESAVPDLPPADSLYLDLAENIVRQAVSWQNTDGRIIDPFEKKETSTATARYVGALGLLIAQGRCADLIDTCARSLTPAVDDLFNRATEWGEFIVKEAVMAYAAVKDSVSGEQADAWARLLSGYDPEKAYHETFTNNPDLCITNWSTFAIAGEMFKTKYGLKGDPVFADRYLARQFERFDSNGMYRDPTSPRLTPNFPMTYDIVTRMNLTLAVWAGYAGEFREKLDETLKQGALAQLLCQSVTGETPYGGRSNQQNFVEATFAVICEFEANRWAKTGDMQMAGAFKRAAALAINSVKKYLDGCPVYFSKNLFDPATQHGRQKIYGFYGAYSLLIASQLGFANLLANREIPDGRCPAECGGFLFQTSDSFRKIFATVGGIHIEIDTNANFKYDATGLGRIHFAGHPPELALSSSMTATPDFLTVIPPAPENIAVDAGWDGRWIAGLNEDKILHVLDVLEEDRCSVKFRLRYDSPDGFILETFTVNSRGLDILVEQGKGEKLLFRVPLLKTNGREKTEIRENDRGFDVVLGTSVYHVECVSGNAEKRIEQFEAPNRNGIYKVATFSTTGQQMQFKFSAHLEGAQA